MTGPDACDHEQGHPGRHADAGWRPIAQEAKPRGKAEGQGGERRDAARDEVICAHHAGYWKVGGADQDGGVDEDVDSLNGCKRQGEARDPASAADERGTRLIGSRG